VLLWALQLVPRSACGWEHTLASLSAWRSESRLELAWADESDPRSA
jgi:hypothetical protein